MTSSAILDEVRRARAKLDALPEFPRLIEVPSLDVIPEGLTKPSGSIADRVFGVPLVVNSDLVHGSYAITDHRGVRTLYVPDNIFGDLAVGRRKRWWRRG